MEKVLILEGLDCPHCAEEIRSGVEKIEGVEKAMMNFMAKKLSYYVHKNEEEIYLKVLKVIKDVEPGVTVLKEKSEEHNHGKKHVTELIIHNLCCANCAEEIRSEVEKMDGVSDVTMNFMAKKMTYCSDDDSDELFQKIKTYIEEIELGAKVERVEAPEKRSRRHETELILKNLDCPHCAEEIRSGVEKLEGISEVTMNFMAKKLSYHADKNNTELYEKIIKVIKDVEPDVEVVKVEAQKKRVSGTAETEVILKNLCCPNCAEEIRSAVEKLDGIEEATMNFMAKKLSYRVAKGADSKGIYENVVKIVKQVEPGVEVEKAEAEKKAVAQTETKKNFDVTSPKVMIVRIAIALAITILTMVMGENLNSTVEFILTLFAYIVIGGDIVWRAVKNILRGKVFDENFLMSLATVCAFIIREHSEAVAVMLFYQVGEYFQSYAVRKSRKSITDLMDIRPDYANVKIGDEVERIEPDEVEVDDIIVVKAGEKVPLDGVVVKGHSSLDTSALTGESVPRDVFEGDNALSGCINQSGILEIRVTKPFAESTVSKILKLVENSGGKKAQTEKFITKFSKWYTPAVVISAVLLALVPPIILGGGFTDWIYRGLSFLVVSCPCALVVSVPLSFFGGIGGASKAGILVKGSNYLEALSKCDTIVFDKTGTLTEGSFTVTEINPINISEDELLKYATVAEWNSNHPIAVSIRERYNKETFYNIDSQEIAGRGIKAMFQGDTILAGNLLLMKENDIFADNPSTSGTVVHIAVNGEYKGNIVISDRIKKDSMLAVSALKNVGVNRICMLTGDNKNSVKEVAGTLGITEYYSDLLPGDKVDKLEEIMKNKKENSVVAFVGDGINDTPVLARADIGIAMGALGSDAAIEVADIVLMHDEPSKIAIGKKIAKKTIRIVNENIVFAIGVKIAILICIALGVLGDASMWWAVFGDVGVAFIAILNAIRALYVKNIK